MTKLIILRGVSGSGKSTWAKAYAQNTGAVVVSRDALRVQFYGSDGPDYYSTSSDVLKSREDTITIIQDSTIAGLLKVGIDVIVDNTNVEWKYVKALAKIGYRYGAEVEIKTFDIPRNVAVERDRLRGIDGGRYVGEGVVHKQYQRFQATKNKTLDPIHMPKPYAGTPGKPKAFMVDIDGTLAHMNNKRGPFDWANVGLDDVDEVIAEIVELIAVGSQESATNENDFYEVIVMSGRDGSCRNETMEWLRKHGIVFDQLFMRPPGDMRPDNIVKAELFDTYVRDNFNVQFVIDDRLQVVQMWQRMGLKVLNVAGLDGGDF